MSEDIDIKVILQGVPSNYKLKENSLQIKHG
ncbi:hypothetical protein AB6F62_11375 [Providencia huaxiensis]